MSQAMGMQKSLLGVLFIMTSAISLFVGYKVGSDRQPSIETGNEVVAKFSDKGKPTEIKLKDLAPFLTVDQADYKKVVYNARTQAVQAFISQKIREGEDLNQVDFEQVSQQEILDMLKKMKLDPKKVSERQRNDIVSNLSIGKRNQAIKTKLDASIESMNVELYLQPPFDFVTTSNQRGLVISENAKNADLDLHWYGNFHCPQCGATFQKILDTLAMAPDKFTVKFSYHGQDPDASIAFQTAKGFYCLKNLKLAKDNKSTFDLMTQAAKSPPQNFESIIALFSGGNADHAKSLSACLSDRNNNTQIREDAANSAKIPGSLQSASFLILENYFVQGSELTDLYQDLVKWVLRIKK